MQLVKHKDTVQYLLYIIVKYEENVWSIQYGQVIIHEVKPRILYLLHEVLTETTMA